jgi:hypothetical protein
VASQECNVARGEDHNVVCARLRCIVITISRGRSRLWPSGLQYYTRCTRIAWPSISLGTGIVPGGFSAICARQLTQICKESSQLLGALITGYAPVGRVVTISVALRHGRVGPCDSPYCGSGGSRSCSENHVTF